MSSTAGEIYVSETIRDACQKELDNLFGQGKWFLLGNSPWLSPDELPDHIAVKVQDTASEKQIATLSVDNKFYVEDMGFHRQIAVRPANIQIIVEVK